MFDNVDLFDEEVRTKSGSVLGEYVDRWAELLALALENEKWASFVDVYNKDEQLELLPTHMGPRFAADGLVVWKGEPIISVIPMTATSHPDDFAKIKDTSGLMKSDSGPATPASATHASGPIEIVTADMKRETADLKTG